LKKQKCFIDNKFVEKKQPRSTQDFQICCR